MNFIPESPVVRERLFLAIKWLTYGWLIYNGYQFFADESLAAQTTFNGQVSVSEIISVYSGSIDTAFWIFLLLLLELETYIIDDEILKKPVVKWSMFALRALCYAVILYAVYGYIVKMLFQADMSTFPVTNPCDLVGQNFSLLTYVEEYEAITMENCQALAGQDLWRLNGHDIIAPHKDLKYALNVSWIDVVNSVVWVAVVAILEVDVWFQLKGQDKGRLQKTVTILKFVLYAILFGCALAWWYTGVFLDFSDAFLWLFAFFFIEMNIVRWQKEIEEEAALTTANQ